MEQTQQPPAPHPMMQAADGHLTKLDRVLQELPLVRARHMEVQQSFMEMVKGLGAVLNEAIQKSTEKDATIAHLTAELTKEKSQPLLTEAIPKVK